jgi:hypothetical protein
MTKNENSRIYIHYFEKTYIFTVNDEFFKQYIINMDDRILDIYYKGSYLNINTINDDLIDEIECRFN